MSAGDEIETVRRLNSILDEYEFAALRDAMEGSAPDAVSSGFPELDALVRGALSPDIVIEFHGEAELLEDNRLHGIDGFLLSWRRWLAAFDHYEVEHGGYEQVGDSVVYDLLHRGRGRGSGLDFELAQAQRWRLRDGLVTEIHVYGSRAEALADCDREEAR